MTSALRLMQLSAWYDRAQSLFNINLDVNEGEVLALIGRNGAGKSTLLKAVAGLVRSTGEVTVCKKRIDTLPPHQRARCGLGYVPEERRIFTDLTVRENLIVGARRRKFDLAPLLALFPNLSEMLDRPSSCMSGGEQQMLAVARTLAARPRIVLLDEPSEGIAPKVVTALLDAIVAMKKSGTAVLLSEQNLTFVNRVADRAVLMAHGHIVGAASRSELVDPSNAVKSVLGL